MQSVTDEKQLGLPKSKRIHRQLDFERIYGLQQRAGDRSLLVFAAANELNESRFGVSVSKKHGNAVKRARLKRLLREAFRHVQHELPLGLDFILIPQRNAGAELADFQRSLIQLARKLNRRISQRKER